MPISKQELDLTESLDEPSSQNKFKLQMRRTPLISVIVLLLGVYLLVLIGKDMRYWLYGQDPIDLGDADAWIESKSTQEDYNNAFVRLRGSPDVQHVALAKIDSRRISYVRLLEGGGSLFVAVERSDEEIKKRQFGEVFTGRMRRLAEVRNFSEIQTYFNNLLIAQNYPVEPKELMAALAANAAKPTSGQKIHLDPEDTVSLTIKEPESKVQLGRRSFPNLETAQAAIENLGYPYYTPPEQTHSQYFQFWLRIPEGQQKFVEQQLQQGLTIPSETNAAYGAIVLPSTITFLVKAADLTSAPEGIAFVYKEALGRTGFVLQDQKLIPRQPEHGLLKFPQEDIHSIRLQKLIQVDPNGYILIAGDDPADYWLSPILWLLVAVIVLVNLINLIVVLYRRTKPEMLANNDFQVSNE